MSIRHAGWSAVIGTILVLGLPACEESLTDSNDGPSYLDDLPMVVEEGKEDNYYSATAQEYFIEGITTVTLESTLAEADDQARMQRVRELIPLKQIVVGWFLNQYLVDKSHDATNREYGGFASLTKNGSYEDFDIRQVDDLTYQFRFRQEVGGQLDLLDEMELTPGDDGKARFTLTIGRISNEEMARLETNHEWYRQSPWTDFNPEQVDESRLDTIELTIWPEPRSEDAWLDYNRLFADGSVTVDVFFGWDYHNEYHLKHSERVYQWLVDRGFPSPVESYDQLTHESEPFVRTFSANGREVTARLRMFWGGMDSETNPDTDTGGRVLESLMRESFLNSEVIVFSGHSGPFYGFALANWRRTDEGDLDDSEIPSLDMPPDTYQVVLAEGCETYALGQAFFMNPNKPGRADLDIITTTNFSNASTPATVQDFIKAIIGTDSEGVHQPLRFRALLRDLDSNSFWYNTMYGVHGIDDNPHGHPYTDFDALCRACQSDADCLSPGMQCTRLGVDEAACTSECTADEGCPAGYTCENVATGSWMEDRQCVPATTGRTCHAEIPIDVEPTVVINEVLADPADDVTHGDANGDGVRDAFDDEFIELVNLAGREIDLAGWTISDGIRVRFTFAEQTVLAPAKALVLFGGGDAGSFGDLGGATVLVATGGLGLNNESDLVILADASGEVVDRFPWGVEGSADVSLVRQTRGDSESPVIPHPGGFSHTAGRDRNGNPF